MMMRFPRAFVNQKEDSFQQQNKKLSKKKTFHAHLPAYWNFWHDLWWIPREQNANWIKLFRIAWRLGCLTLRTYAQKKEVKMKEIQSLCDHGFRKSVNFNKFIRSPLRSNPHACIWWRAILSLNARCSARSSQHWQINILLCTAAPRRISDTQIDAR